MNNDSTSIITQTPMRITLGGGGTDVIWYSKLKGGAWISAAINRYVRVKITNSQKPDSLRIYDNDEELYFEDINKLSNPIIRECLRTVDIRGGLEINTQSDVPARSGLGGSGAFEVGLLNALHYYKQNPATPLTLAKEAALIEIKKLKKPVGPQDQYITALGGIKHFKIDKKGQVFAENLNLTKETISKLQTNLLFFSTGINRDAEIVLGDQKKKVQESIDTSSKVIKALDEIKNLGIKVKKNLIKGEVDEFGRSLHTHWLIKKTLSDKVSNPKIDEWYNLALETGALGGKIMGAGGGGWFVFYVSKKRDKFIGRMSRSGLIPQQVNFDFEGTKLLT